MNQSVAAGVIFILFGVILEGTPSKIWHIAEKWKSRDAQGPSDLFILVSRILGGLFCILGILLLLGVIK